MDEWVGFLQEVLGATHYDLMVVDGSHALRGNPVYDALRHACVRARTRSVLGCVPTQERGNDQTSQ